MHGYVYTKTHVDTKFLARYPVLMDRQTKYRKATLAERGAKNVAFVAEKDDQANLDAIQGLTGASKTGAIRKALEHYRAFLESKLEPKEHPKK